MTEVRKECCALLSEHAVELREDIEREIDGLHCEGAEVRPSRPAHGFVAS